MAPLVRPVPVLLLLPGSVSPSSHPFLLSPSTRVPPLPPCASPPSPHRVPEKPQALMLPSRRICCPLELNTALDSSRRPLWSLISLSTVRVSSPCSGSPLQSTKRLRISLRAPPGPPRCSKVSACIGAPQTRPRNLVCLRCLPWILLWMCGASGEPRRIRPTPSHYSPGPRSTCATRAPSPVLVQ